MEYEVWTGSGCQEHLCFAATTFYHHLLVPLRDTLREPEHLSQPHNTMQSRDNNATICIVVHIDSAWPCPTLRHVVVLVAQQQDEGFIDISSCLRQNQLADR